MNNDQNLEDLITRDRPPTPHRRFAAVPKQAASPQNVADTRQTKLAWPQLMDLKLCDQALAARRDYLGGSEANTLMSGNAERVRQLWLEKRGEAVAPDFSENLAVALGSWTEAFNRQWFQRVTGKKVVLAGTVITCSTYTWRRCTLDGFIEEENAIWEAKHTNAFGRPDEVLERYMPQLQHNMALMKADRAILSVIFGNHKFEIFEVEADWLYQFDLLEAEEQFWNCVLTGDEPAPAPLPPAPRCYGVREICLEGNNAWASAAVDWLTNREAAKTHTAAAALIKSLVEEDVARAFGHGIEAKRSKSGALSIREFAR